MHTPTQLDETTLSVYHIPSKNNVLVEEIKVCTTYLGNSRIKQKLNLSDDDIIIGLNLEQPFNELSFEPISDYVCFQKDYKTLIVMSKQAYFEFWSKQRHNQIPFIFEHDENRDPASQGFFASHNFFNIEKDNSKSDSIKEYVWPSPYPKTFKEGIFHFFKLITMLESSVNNISLENNNQTMVARFITQSEDSSLTIEHVKQEKFASETNEKSSNEEALHTHAQTNLTILGQKVIIPQEVSNVKITLTSEKNPQRQETSDKQESHKEPNKVVSPNFPFFPRKHLQEHIERLESEIAQANNCKKKDSCNATCTKEARALKAVAAQRTRHRIFIILFLAICTLLGIFFIVSYTDFDYLAYLDEFSKLLPSK